MKRYLFVTTVLVLAIFLLQSCADKKTEKVISKNVQYVSGADEVNYIKLGNEITDTVGTTLKANLMAAMKNGGPVSAVTFCNMNAMELTEVYSEKYNTEVRRVSDRNRNEANQPDKMEMDVIADFKNMLEQKQPLSSKVAIDAEGRKHFYAPIFTGGLCLSCHGDPKNMQPELLSAIDSLYPSDKARDFKVDELRGIWSIKFKNS